MRCLKFVEKVCFYKYRANSLSLTPNPFPVGRGYITGATAPDQARMLAVSRTKPLHDAVAQMADDLYGGFAPATPFLIFTRGFSTVLRHRLCGALSYICRFYRASFSSSFSSIVIIINAIVINTAHIITAH